MVYPTKRTKEIEQEILSRLSKGETLSEICRDAHMPSVQSYREWCRSDKTLEIAHGKARDDGFDAIAEECLRIAEDGANDWMTKNAGDATGWLMNGEHVQRSKLRVETRLKLLAKWDPRRYGDKTQVTGDGGGPVLGTLTVEYVKPDKS